MMKMTPQVIRFEGLLHLTRMIMCRRCTDGVFRHFSSSEKFQLAGTGQSRS